MVEAMDRRELRTDIRRRSIVEAAACEFAEVGFEHATLDGIGARVGLTKAGLYHYIESKEQLLAILLDEVIVAIEERSAELAPPGASAAERLEAFVTAHVEIGVGTPSGRVMARDLESVLTIPSTKALRQRHQSNLEDILEAGIRSNEFRPLPTGAVVQMLFASVNSIPRWFNSEGALGVEELMRITTSLFLSGVRGADPGSSDG